MSWSSFYGEMIGRNIGILSRTEQDIIRHSCVSVAGCGGIGGIVAEQLVRVGVGELRIADPDCFELSNFNRQTGATLRSIGQNKAAVLACYLSEINPELHLQVVTDGVQVNNVSEFLRGADIAVDAIDYRRLHDSVILHRQAREHNICIINPQAVGFGASVVVFGQNTTSIEDYVGIGNHASEEELERYAVPIAKFCPHVPSYADMSLLEKVVSGEADIPTIVIGPHFSTAIAVGEVIALLTGRIKEPVGPAPRTYVLDLLDRKFEVTG